MTALIEMRVEVAAELAPGMVAVEVGEIRALRWLAVAPPVEVEIRAVVLAADSATSQVRVVIEGYARSTVTFAPGYPEAPAPAAPPLRNPRRAPTTAERLYAERWMFHGPAYQGVKYLGEIGDDGIDGVLEVGAAQGALLDNAGQLMGFWVMVDQERDRLALPTSIDRIRLFGPQPPVGAEVDTRVRISRLDEVSVRADHELSHGGRIWVRIEGWEDRRFDTDERVWPVYTFTEDNTLAEEQPGGWVLARERWRSSAARELMMRRYLSVDERQEYGAANPKAQRLYLLGRVAAKDAVRRWLEDRGVAPVWPVEVIVGNEPSGRPTLTLTSVDVPAGAALRVSIAHSGFMAVAMVGDGVDVGIDLEQVEPRSERFAATAFSPDELERLLGGRPPSERDEWLTRGWAAKEAVAKAAGTGLGGRPKDFVIESLEGEEMVVNGQPVQTVGRGEVVVAFTLERSTRGKP
jgi:phosphopantetheine--protein transferase-like protein